MIALALGAADCLFDDLEEIGRLVPIEQCIIVACNDAGIVYPDRLDHWVTLHPEELERRKVKRAERGYPDGFETWTRPYPYGMKERERICDHVIGGFDGSSGLAAVGVGLASADVVVAGGLPMDDRPHILTGRRWHSCVKYRPRWEELYDRLKGRVRSMSGWTMELLGEPTADWLLPHMSPLHNATAQPVVLTTHP